METKAQTDKALRAAFEFLRRSRKTVLRVVAESVGRSRRHLQAVLSPTEDKPMGGELARKIAAFYGLPYEAFLELGERILNGEKGDEALRQVRAKYPVVATGKVTLPMMQIRGKGHVEPPNVEPAEMPKRGGMVPLISSVRAGLWTAAEGLEPGEAEEWMDAPAGVGARAFALRVVGDSMEPRFQEGEIIIVDPDIEAASGDYVVASLEREDATLKRYLREGGRDFLVPLNRRYDPIEMTGRDWRIVGRVMEKRQKF